MTNRIRVLFLAANPVDSGYRMRVDEEVREIDERIRAGSIRDSFELISQFAVRPSDLALNLMRHQPHIVHFSGHGNKSEGIILEDKDGNMKPVNKGALAELFRSTKKNIRIVMLNACHAKRQAEGIVENIDFAIGMNKTIGDKDAIVFASHFYQALAFGESIQAAFDLGKNQIRLEGLPGFKTPALLVRQGADPAATLLAEDGNQLLDRKTQPHTDRGAVQQNGYINNSPGGTINNVVGDGNQLK